MQAKEFIVSRIVDEAERNNVALTEVERKMLYFSETYPTLPEMMELAREFDANYDSDKYEEKIKRLAKLAFERDRKESPENARLWRNAIGLLQTEDHYILVMLDVPGPSKIRVSLSWAREAKLLVEVLAVALVFWAAVAGAKWAGRSTHIRIPDSIKSIAFVLLIALTCYLGYSHRGKKISDWLASLSKRMPRWF